MLSASKITAQGRTALGAGALALLVAAALAAAPSGCFLASTGLGGHGSTGSGGMTASSSHGSGGMATSSASGSGGMTSTSASGSGGTTSSSGSGGATTVSSSSSSGTPTGFGVGVTADPSLLASYPGIVAATAGAIYPQTGAAAVTQIVGGSTDPVYENRGATADPYGGGVWCFPSTINLAPSPFDFSTSGGWTIQGTMTETASGITAPDGTTNAQKVYQTTTSYADAHFTIPSTPSPLQYSCWYRWDATNPPPAPPYPALTRGAFTPFTAGILPSAGTWTRASVLFAGGTSTAVGLTPSGSSATGAAVNTGAGAIEAWGFQATNGVHDLPLLSGTASAAKTLDAARSALLIDKDGNLDFEVTFQTSTSWLSESGTAYLWSATTADGLMSLRATVATSLNVPAFVLTVRGVDVLDTSVGAPGVSGQFHESQPGEPFTVRAWYNLTAGVSGIRLSVAGLYLPDSTSSAAGTVLAAPSQVYLGTNLGSAAAAFSGRMKPYRRPAALAAAPAQAQVEGIMIGDSIVSPTGTAGGPADGVGSYVYTQGAAGEWTTRAGIGDLARPLDKIAGQVPAWWSNPINQWHQAAYIKWFFVQVGINDVLASRTAAQIITDLQAAVTTLKADCPTAKIVLATMLPARSYQGMNPAMYAVWQAVNVAIVGGGATPITGASAILDTAATGSPWNDGSDNLALAVDSGDHLHTNTLGRFKQAQDPTYGLRPKLTALGLLP